MLNSIDHEICIFKSIKMQTNETFFLLRTVDDIYSGRTNKWGNSSS